MENKHYIVEIMGNGKLPQPVICIASCEICREAMPLEKVFNNNHHCSHPFCTDCISQYIHVKVEERVGDIRCPSLNCKQLLDPIFCRSIIPKSTFDRWCDHLCTSAVLQTKQRCFCPYPDCSDLVLNECEATGKAECPTCKRYFCFLCKLPWHGNRYCFEEEDREIGDMGDVLFGKLCKEKGWARCFNCGQCVELLEGCRHIVCRCGVSFCYYCGEEMSINQHDCRQTQLNAAEHREFALLIFISGFVIFCIVALSYLGAQEAVLSTRCMLRWN